MTRNNPRCLCASLIAVSFLMSSIPAGADEAEPSPGAKYRHEVMETMGKNFAAMAMVFQGRVDAPEHLQVHAEALARTASLIGDLFAPGSEGGHALPLIWEEPEGVAEAADDSAATAAALVDAAASGDKAATAKALKAAGDSCKACHERYKEEDEEEDHEH